MARLTIDRENDDNLNNKNYQVSEANNECKDNKESVIPQCKQEYQKMEIPASKFYENYDEKSDRKSVAVMTVISIDKEGLYCPRVNPYGMDLDSMHSMHHSM